MKLKEIQLDTFSVDDLKWFQKDIARIISEKEKKEDNTLSESITNSKDFKKLVKIINNINIYTSFKVTASAFIKSNEIDIYNYLSLSEFKESQLRASINRTLRFDFDYDLDKFLYELKSKSKDKAIDKKIKELNDAHILANKIHKDTDIDILIIVEQALEEALW